MAWPCPDSEHPQSCDRKGAACVCRTRRRLDRLVRTESRFREAPRRRRPWTPRRSGVHGRSLPAGALRVVLGGAVGSCRWQERAHRPGATIAPFVERLQPHIESVLGRSRSSSRLWGPSRSSRTSPPRCGRWWRPHPPSTSANAAPFSRRPGPASLCLMVSPWSATTTGRCSSPSAPHG